MQSPRNTIILYNSVDYFLSFFKKKNVLAYSLWKDHSFFSKILKKMAIALKLPKTHWYGDWKWEIDKCETVILFVNSRVRYATLELEALKYILRRKKDIKIIFWYWNPICRSIAPSWLPKNIGEIWSFDPSDCVKYNLKFNTTFYFDNIYIRNENIVIDILFLGFDKGRRKSLEELDKKFTSLGLKTYFHIVADNYSKNEEVKPLPYTGYLELLAKSRVILDILPDGQDGMTLRSMEALFFKKKLITNDERVKYYDFYRPENIFILGVDDDNRLYDFVRLPCEVIDPLIVKQYDVLSWLDRFFNSSEPK